MNATFAGRITAPHFLGFPKPADNDGGASRTITEGPGELKSNQFIDSRARRGGPFLLEAMTGRGRLERV
jgi:hypothetical protein